MRAWVCVCACVRVRAYTYSVFFAQVIHRLVYPILQRREPVSNGTVRLTLCPQEQWRPSGPAATMTTSLPPNKGYEV